MVTGWRMSEARRLSLKRMAVDIQQVDEVGGSTWADPGYFIGRSRVRNALRILKQLVLPPKGHRTIPTKSGGLFIALTIGIGTAAFNTGQNVLYVALALMLSSILVSGILSWFNFKGCRWRLEAGHRFRAKEVSPVVIHAHNAKRWLPTHALEFRLGADGLDKPVILALPEQIDPGKAGRIQWDFQPQQRGKVTLRLLRVSTSYPFGFLDKSIRHSISHAVVVWPARIEYTWKERAAGGRLLHGRSRQRGDGVDLRALRTYREGDPQRAVHWKASAKLGKLMVRETERETQPAHSLFVDPSPNLWTPEAFETLCSFAASLAEDLFERDQLRYAMVLGEENLAMRELADLYLFLDTLAQLQPREGKAEMQRPKGVSWIDFKPAQGSKVTAVREGDIIGEAG